MCECMFPCVRVCLDCETGTVCCCFDVRTTQRPFEASRCLPHSWVSMCQCVCVCVGESDESLRKKDKAIEWQQHPSNVMLFCSLFISCGRALAAACLCLCVSVCVCDVSLPVCVNVCIILQLLKTIA